MVNRFRWRRLARVKTGDSGKPAIINSSMEPHKKSGKTSKARVVAKAQLPTGFGAFRILGIKGSKPGEEAVARVE